MRKASAYKRIFRKAKLLQVSSTIHQRLLLKLSDQLIMGFHWSIDSCPSPLVRYFNIPVHWSAFWRLPFYSEILISVLCYFDVILYFLISLVELLQVCCWFYYWYTSMFLVALLFIIEVFSFFATCDKQMSRGINFLNNNKEVAQKNLIESKKVNVKAIHLICYLMFSS